MSTPDTAAIRNKVKVAVETLRNANDKSYIRDGGGDIAITMTRAELSQRGYPALPDDYAALLSEAYGIMGSYFTLVGIGSMEMAGGALQADLIEMSDAYNRWNDDDEAKVLVVGKMSGGVVIIHKDGQYHIVDQSSRDVFASYDDIADFITDTVSRLDKARAAQS